MSAPIQRRSHGYATYDVFADDFVGDGGTTVVSGGESGGKVGGGDGGEGGGEGGIGDGGEGGDAGTRSSSDF